MAYPFRRKLVSIAANRLARLLLDVPLHELTTSFRAFRTTILRELDFTMMRTQGYGFFLESVYRIHERGFTCREIPIDFRDRKHGISKIPRFEIFRGVGSLFRLFLSRLFSSSLTTRSGRLAEDTCPACQSRYVIEAGRHGGIREAFRRDPGRAAQCLACGEVFVLPSPQQRDDAVVAKDSAPFAAERASWKRG